MRGGRGGSGGTTGTAGDGGVGGSAGSVGRGGTGGSAGATAGSGGAAARGGTAGGSGGARGGAGGRGGTSGTAGTGGAPPPLKKFVGNIDTRGQVRSDFSMYWDQLSPENAGKWGSVERTRDQMNWTALDAMHNVRQGPQHPLQAAQLRLGQPAAELDRRAVADRAEAPRWRSGSASSASAIRTRS